MFDHRSSKLTLRKEFERRTGETFKEYFHDKIIMANRISVDADEIIDYVIDGIPDPRLRDQARLQRYAADLVEAFENITLRNHPRVERNPAGINQQKSKKEPRPATTERTESNPAPRGIRCFNCKEKGHRSTECTKPRAVTGKRTTDLVRQKVRTKRRLRRTLSNHSLGPSRIRYPYLTLFRTVKVTRVYFPAQQLSIQDRQSV